MGGLRLQKAQPLVAAGGNRSFPHLVLFATITFIYLASDVFQKHRPPSTFGMSAADGIVGCIRTAAELLKACMQVDDLAACSWLEVNAHFL